MKKLNIALGQINPTVGDLVGNKAKILAEFEKAKNNNCDLLILPEMAICGYDCGDLWLKEYFIDEISDKILEICAKTKNSKTAILFGSPTIFTKNNRKNTVYNSAILVFDGEVKNIINKKSLPNSSVFDEKRYFESENFLSYVEFGGFTINILICEDMWNAKNLYLAKEQIFDFTIVINASPFLKNKQEKRLEIAKNYAIQTKKPLIYVNMVGAQDSLVFDGASFILNNEGKVLLKMADFVEDFSSTIISKNGEFFNLANSQIFNFENNDFSKTYQACVLGLREYIVKNGFKNILLGMSGGIDSALVATIAVDALGFENVKLYALPTRFNSNNSMNDALNCANNLNVKLEVISIENIFNQMLETLGEVNEIAKQNLQSRIRGNILMALSNNSGALLLSTGNKSELAVGYATIYGDMCGAFNPIKDLYKTEIYDLAKWRNENYPEISYYQKIDLIPENILTKEPTAELRENQKDSDSLPEYEILDKILFCLIEEEKSIEQIINQGFDEILVKKVAKLFYQSEYKRSQSCLGVKVSSMSFGKERRYPITNLFNK